MADLPRKGLWPLYPNSEKSSCLLLILSVTRTCKQSYGLNELQMNDYCHVAFSSDSVVLLFVDLI